MLDRVRPDVVVIATPVRSHAELAITALQRNIHVLLEKPMTHDLASAHALVQAAARSKAVLQIGFEFRSSPLIRKVHQIIRSGELGEVVVVWTSMFRGPAPATDTWRGQVGLFFDCMIHEIDGMLGFAGADFERVAAFGGAVGAKGLKPADRPPHTVTACVEFSNAVRGSITFSERSQSYDNTHFGVVGDKGRIDGGLWEPSGAGSLKVYTDGGLYRTTIEIDGEKTSRGHLGFAEQYDFFTATIRDGAPNVSDAANALRTQRLVAAVERAMCEGRVIERQELVAEDVDAPRR
jgi:predicted dehydrogenase